MLTPEMSFKTSTSFRVVSSEPGVPIRCKRARNDALQKDWQRQLEEQERRAAYVRGAGERLQKENFALQEAEQQALDLRKRKRAWFCGECTRQERLLRTGNKSRQCCFTPNSRPYQTVCDNCFKNVGDQEYVSACELHCICLLGD